MIQFQFMRFKLILNTSPKFLNLNALLFINVNFNKIDYADINIRNVLALCIL